ncbi:MAG TPA: hypothetical protein VK141_05340 [Nitrosomonas sp.]|nr:hypothetical protein [Nitrosomonas sp.]
MKYFCLVWYIFTFTVVVFSGCSSTYTVSNQNEKNNTEEISYPTVNKQIKNYSVRVTLNDNTEYDVPHFQLEKDSSLIILEDGRNFLIPNPTIASLRTVNHTKGAVVGFLLGALGGLVVGGVVTANSGNPESAGGGATQGFLIGGVTGFGAIAGSVWGGIKGMQMFYELK